MSYLERVKRYYRSCWNPRLKNGHNKKSRAVHFGYYPESVEIDPEKAKLELNKYMTEKLDLSDEKKVILLDAGSGIGGTAIYIAEMFKNIQVAGITISAEQVEIAGEIIEEKHLADRVRIYKRDYHNNGFPAEYFDAVYGIESVCHSDNKPLFFRESFRTLKRGGRMVLIDFFQEKEPESAEDKILLRQLLSGWALPDCYSGIDNILVQGPFANYSFRDISDKVRPGIERSALKARKLLENPPSESADFIRHLKACAALLILLDSDIIRYKSLTLKKTSTGISNQI